MGALLTPFSCILMLTRPHRWLSVLKGTGTVDSAFWGPVPLGGGWAADGAPRVSGPRVPCGNGRRSYACLISQVPWRRSPECHSQGERPRNRHLEASCHLREGIHVCALLGALA